MKNNYLQLLLLAVLFTLGTNPVFAQIPSDSPIPVDVIMELPGSGSTRLITEYASMVNSVEWGTQPLRQTVSAEVVWVDDDGMSGFPDTLGCDTTSMADYTDKIVLVRRGECFFSDKIFFAQEAGAIGVIIINADGSDGLGTMGSGNERGLAVTIPAVFFNVADDGAFFIPALDAGETVIATFQVREFFGELGPNEYATPLSQVRPMDSIQVDVLNLDSDNPLLDISAQVVITDPSNNETTLTSAIDTIRPEEIHSFEFEAYTPTEVGLYNMVYTNSLTPDTLERQFEITEFTFQKDNGNIPEWPVDSWIAQSNQNFVDEALLIYDIGSLYFTPNETKATHFTFSIGNPDSLYRAFNPPPAHRFELVLYDTDPDGDGIGVLGEHENYDNYEQVASEFYVLTGTEEPYDLLTVALEEPVTLKAGGQYLLMVKYNGINSALGIPPWYTYAGTEAYPGRNTLTFTDMLYTDGWSGDFRAVVRLHLEGFTPMTSTYTPLATKRFDLVPNPADEQLQLLFELEQPADYLQIRVIDMLGQLHLNERHSHLQVGSLTIDVAQLPAGTYLMAVNTPNGYKVEQFVVVH